jgi:hypothetical protein
MDPAGASGPVIAVHTELLPTGPSTLSSLVPLNKLPMSLEPNLLGVLAARCLPIAQCQRQTKKVSLLQQEDVTSAAALAKSTSNAATINIRSAVLVVAKVRQVVMAVPARLSQGAQGGGKETEQLLVV